jgi:hypothetical protein
MDLRQREMRVLKVNLLGAPCISHLVQNDFGHLDSHATYPGYPLGVKVNLRSEDRGHGSLLAPVYAGMGGAARASAGSR